MKWEGERRRRQGDSEGGTTGLLTAARWCPWKAGDSWVQTQIFLLLLPKVESTPEPPRAEPGPCAGRELKTKPRIFRGEINLSV